MSRIDFRDYDESDDGVEYQEVTFKYGIFRKYKTDFEEFGTFDSAILRSQKTLRDFKSRIQKTLPPLKGGIQEVEILRAQIKTGRGGNTRNSGNGGAWLNEDQGTYQIPLFTVI